MANITKTDRDEALVLAKMIVKADASEQLPPLVNKERALLLSKALVWAVAHCEQWNG